MLITDGHVWPAGIALTAPGERGILHKIEFAFDEDSEHRFNRAYRRVGKRVPKQCIISTLTGLFETREDWSQHKAVYPNGTSKFIGFGHLDEAPGQLIMKSEDTAAIEPNCTAKTEKPRD